LGTKGATLIEPVLQLYVLLYKGTMTSLHDSVSK